MSTSGAVGTATTTGRRLRRGDRLVVASHNAGKIAEIVDLVRPYGIAVATAVDLGITEPEETEPTFAGNARLKALHSARATGLPALADDSGLEVAALDDAPGIYSARWAGPSRDFAFAMRQVADAVNALGAWTPPGPAAGFICALCLAWPDGETAVFEGRVPGYLVWPPRGTNGFGYDAMFVASEVAAAAAGAGAVPPSFGEMPPRAKHAISHRARAFVLFVAACLASGPVGWDRP